MALDDDSCTCALLARAIYRPGDIGEMLAGWHGMSVCKIWTQDMFYRHLATAILLRREGETVGYLAFKGSSYFYDWLADGLVVPKPAVSGTAHCHYHSGFYNTCRSVSDSIVTAMTYCGIGSLVVTGHSLGGALAGTFALLHPKLVSKIITFGAPKYIWTDGKPGDEQKDWPFANFTAKISPTIENYIHAADPVPRLLGRFGSHRILSTFMSIIHLKAPITWITGYSHLGTLIHIGTDGRESPFLEANSPIDSLWKIFYNASDHSVTKYVTPLCRIRGHVPLDRELKDIEEEERLEAEEIEATTKGVAGSRMPTPREQMIEMMLPHVHYFEIPSKECASATDRAECDAIEGCEWIGSMMTEFDVCRRRLPEKIRSARDSLADLIEKSTNIVGYTPTADDVKRLVATTILSEKTVPPHIAELSRRQRELGARFLSFFARRLLDHPTWSSVQFDDAPVGMAPGSGGILGTPPQFVQGGMSRLIEIVPPVYSNEIMYDRVEKVLSPGDIIVIGNIDTHRDPNMRRVLAGAIVREDVYFKTVVFLGRLSRDETMKVFVDARQEVWDKGAKNWYDICLMADGETEAGAKRFITNAMKIGAPSMEKDYAYMETGYIRLVDLESEIDGADYVRVAEVAPETRKNLMEIYTMGLSSIGLYAFQLQRSNGYHFANYIVTGRWVDSNSELHRSAFKYDTRAFFSMYPDPVRLGVIVPDVSNRVFSRLRYINVRLRSTNGQTCSILTPIRCMIREKQLIYDRMMQLLSEIERNEDRAQVLMHEKEEADDKLGRITDREQAEGFDKAYVNLIAKIQADIDDMTDVTDEQRSVAEAYIAIILSEIKDFVLIRSNGRYFCWDREYLARLLISQAMRGDGPYDPVTLLPMSMKDLWFVIGEGHGKPSGAEMEAIHRMDARLSRERFWKLGDDAVEVQDMAGKLREHIRHKLDHISSPSGYSEMSDV